MNNWVYRMKTLELAVRAFQMFVWPIDKPTNRLTDMTSYRSSRMHLKSPSQSFQLDLVYFFIAYNCLGQNLYFVQFLQCVVVLSLKNSHTHIMKSDVKLVHSKSSLLQVVAGWFVARDIVRDKVCNIEMPRNGKRQGGQLMIVCIKPSSPISDKI